MNRFNLKAYTSVRDIVCGFPIWGMDMYAASEADAYFLSNYVEEPIKYLFERVEVIGLSEEEAMGLDRTFSEPFYWDFGLN